MVFSRDCEYPYWDGLQPRVRISSFVTVCAFQKPTHPIPWNAKMMNLYFYIILTAEIIKHKHGTNLLNKLKITAILQWFQMCTEGSMEMVPRRYTGSCSEEEVPSWTQSANWTLKKPLCKLLLVLQVGKFGLPQSPFKYTTTQWKSFHSYSDQDMECARLLKCVKIIPWEVNFPPLPVLHICTFCIHIKHALRFKIT